jgi:hypothetical protein
MNARFVLSLIAALVPCVAAAQVSVNDANSTMSVTIDPASTYYLGLPSDPMRLPRKIEWTVDGRTILVYPSGPWGLVDVEHFHSMGHVNVNQVHMQGPMLGYGTSTVEGTVTGGAIYTVTGGPAGSGTSRIVEKVDIHNKTGQPLTVSLTGMGFKPTQTSIPAPDYTGIDVSGTTVVFFQGNALKYSISDPLPMGFPPMFPRPMVSFTGFNPLFNESFTIPDGAVLTMITELNVKPHVLTKCEINPIYCYPRLFPGF